jgi:DNA-binding transcriptional MerR regulator
MAIEIIQLSAKGQYQEALIKAKAYHSAMCHEKAKAEEATGIIHDLINNISGDCFRGEGGNSVGVGDASITLKRSEAANHLGITIDTLRNWELNGLLKVKRKSNGYRIYTDEDIKELKIIRTLRSANYSLMSILRMLNHLRNGSNNQDLRLILDTPSPDEDIVYLTDKLLTSLSNAVEDTKEIIEHISKRLD